MALDSELLSRLANGDHEPIEDAWLERLDGHLGELSFFFAAARALEDHGRDSVARSLAELLDETLVELQLWPQRLETLRELGDRFLPSERLHRQLLRTLREQYQERPSLEALIESVGLLRATDDIPKTWQKVEKLETLLGFDVGTVVHMDGKGAGRVVDVNLALSAFKVDFPGHRGLTVGFAAAKKMLTPLAEKHVLRRRLEDPEGLRSLSRDDPSELLRLVLTSWDRPLTAGEVRQAVDGIVDASGWTSWWSTARKHPQVVSLRSGRQQYAWAASEQGALDSVWERFAVADVAEQVELFRTQAGRDRELEARMRSTLEQRAAAAPPNEAFAIGVALERSGVDVSDREWNPARLLQRGDPLRLIATLSDRTLRERAYELLPEVSESWSEQLADRMLLEDDARLLDRLARLLPEEVQLHLEPQLLAQPHRAPGAFTWLAERAAEDEPLRERHAARLWVQILAASGHEALAPYRRRLAALADSGSTLPRLLPHLDSQAASLADEALQRASGLEDYQRQPLRTALHVRFPELEPEREMPFYATAPAIASRREELRHLKEVEIPANRKAIQEARELGDLRENFEYKSARQRHEYLASRQAALERDLGRVRPIDFSHIDATTIRIGTRARLAGSDGRQVVVTILGPWDSDPESGVLSNESELAQRLLGKAVGDRVEDDELVVEAIEVAEPA